MTKRMLVVGAVIALIVAMASVALTDVPQLISFQGRLYDDAGVPLTGGYEITFCIYDVEEGGAPLWSETDSVECEGGLYNVILGLQVPLDLIFDRDFWLGMQVTGDAEELSPRYRIVSVPYSFRAAVADSAVNASMLDGRTLAAFMDTSNDFGRPGVASDLYEGLTRLADKYLGKTDQAVDSDKLDGKHAHAFADSAHQHDDRYYTETELSSPGTMNQGSNPVDWGKLKNVPTTSRPSN